MNDFIYILLISASCKNQPSGNDDEIGQAKAIIDTYAVS